MAHAMSVPRTAGRSATVDLLCGSRKVGGNDPAIRMGTACITHLAMALWDRGVPGQWTLGLWNSATAWLATNKASWNAAADPIRAAFLSMKRIGWTITGTGTAETSQGDKINFMTTCPKTTQQAAEKDMETYIIKGWATRHDELRELGPSFEPWLDPLRHAATCEGNTQWTELQQSLAVARVAGAFDYTTKDICPCCGVQNTHQHQMWGCVADYSWRERYGFPDGLVKQA